MEPTDDITIAKLISRCLLGAATPQQMDELEQWLALSAENRRLFERLSSGVSLQARLEADAHTDLRQELDTIYIKAGNRKRRVQIRRIAVAAVAAAVVIVAFLIPWAHFSSNVTPGSFTAPGEQVVELLFEGGERQVIRKGVDTMIRHDALAVVNQGNTLVFAGNVAGEDSGDHNIRHVVKVPVGSEYNVELDDGTRIHLFPASKLTLPPKFGDGPREVALEGEAYFEVTHTGAPFVVRTAGDMTVKVYGTAFNIMAYPGEQTVEATLVRGSIGVKTPGMAQEQMLTSGHQAVWDTHSRSLAVHQTDTEAYTSWQQDVFVFDGVELGAIARRLSRWYGVEIVVDSPALSAAALYIKIPKCERLDTILDRLKIIKDFTYTVTDNRVILTEN